MGRAQSKSILRQSIAEILGTGEPVINAAAQPGPFRKSLIYGSMALLIVNPAQVGAVGLGEMSVNSRLGQPLNATVPVTLAPGESMPQNCIAPTRGNSGIGTPANLQVATPAATQAGTYNLRVTTANPLHEPMYEISLLIDCPGTPLLLRQYVLMLDLPVMAVLDTPSPATDFSAPTVNQGDTLIVPAPTAQPVSQPVSQTMTTPPAKSGPRAARDLHQSRDAIPAGKPYRISKGDTLSTIAARVDGRAPDTTWSVASLIFSMNPQAFIRNNPNLIKLGSKINIPDVTQLVGLATGRTANISVAAATPVAVRPEPAREPRPAPVPKPVATPDTTNRQETSVSEPEPERRDATTQDNVAATSTSITVAADQPVAVQSTEIAAAEAPVMDTDIISPFLDEQPAPLVTEPANGPTAEFVSETVVQPVPDVTTTSSESSDTPNSLIAIIVGMLLGLAISVLMFQRKIIGALFAQLRRRTPAAARQTARAITSPTTPARKDTVAVAAEANNFDTLDTASTFDTSGAASVFESQQNEIEPLPIKEAMENTYIVETSVAETTVLDNAKNFAPGRSENSGELPVNPEDEMLSQLFDESSSTLDGLDNEIFDPTGGIDMTASGASEDPMDLMMPERIDKDDQSFDATIEVPAEFDHDTLDPTAEMPVGSTSAAIDATVEMPHDPDEDLIPSLTSALDGILDDIDADELFATADNLTDVSNDLSHTAGINDSPTVTSHHSELTPGDDDKLSRTMRDAMSLLEEDFNDEFTASQILERSEINRLLDNEQDENTEDADPLPDKEVSS